MLRPPKESFFPEKVNPDVVYHNISFYANQIPRKYQKIVPIIQRFLRISE
jgi:hypothetical protein